MKHYIILPLILLSAITLKSQNTEQYIRVVGTAQKEFTASGVVATIVISEQKADAANNQMYVPFEAAYTNFLEELFTLGITEDKLSPSIRPQANVSSYPSKEYILRTPDVKTAEKLLAISAHGVRIADLKYSYNQNFANVATELSKAAMADAHQKAKALASEARKTLGKIYNIEDLNGGCCDRLPDSSFDNTTLNYKVTLTFEMN